MNAFRVATRGVRFGVQLSRVLEKCAVKIDGRCHCGLITFEAEIDSEKVWLCHCTDCQTLSGSAFRTAAPTRKGAFTLLSGEVKTYVKIGSSGPMARVLPRVWVANLLDLRG